MPSSTILSIAALVALLPSALLPLRRPYGKNVLFWALLAVAIAGPLLVVHAQFASGWRTGLSSALWLTVVVSLVMFAGLAAASRAAWRLTPVLMPYLILIGILALIWQNEPERPLPEDEMTAWTLLHIGFGLVTYGLLTLGAMAGLAVTLQERALKAKRPTVLTAMLPSVADSEDLQVRLLSAGAAVLGCGLLSGMAAQYFVDGTLVSLTHKTVLSLATFVVLVGVLVAHHRTGVRGRRAALYVLLAYLLLTLGYPGVKFVTDVALS